MVELALTYEDEADISDYAFPYIQLAQAFGLITGYEDNTLRSRKELNRGEAVALLMRQARWLETK